jgi:hypothetical protein
VKDVQQALFVHAKPVSVGLGKTTDIPLRRFCVERCTPGSPAPDALPSERIAEPHEKVETTPSKPSLLDWHRTRNDPFKHDWELIASWVLAHPERNSGELFRELQRLFPERYQPSHLRTFQRGIRKIRAQLREMLEGQCLEGRLQTALPDLASSEKPEQETGKTTDPVAIMLPPQVIRVRYTCKDQRCCPTSFQRKRRRVRREEQPASWCRMLPYQTSRTVTRCAPGSIA